MSAREKALVRLCKMGRLAADDRTPDGERVAALERIGTLILRYEFTADEIAAAKQREERSEESRMARMVRERREAMETMRQQPMQMPVFEWSGIFVHGNQNMPRQTIFIHFGQ